MIENGYNLPGLRLGEPGYIVARAVAKDPGLTTVFPLENGSRALSAIEVQQELVNAARKMSSDVELSHEEQWTIDEWDKALSDLAQSPKLTFDRVEWVARLATLNSIHEKQGLGWGSERMRYKDRQFSDITINGIALALRESEKAWAKYMPSEDLIKRRVHDAPTETRANIRGAFIKNMPQNNPGGVSVNWHRIMHHQIPYHLPDPYQVYSRRLASVNYTTW